MESIHSELKSHNLDRRDLIPRHIMAILDNVENLPTLPQVFANLNRIIQNDQSSVGDLVKVINADQALTARILKYGNSPLFRGRKPIENVHQAIVRLGFREVKEISLSIMVYEGLFRQSCGAYFNRAQFWKHSFLVGYACQELAEITNREHLKSVAFVAGLLHDVGIIIQDKFFPQHFSHLITSIDARRETLEVVELGADIPSHSLIGGYILEKWRLPSLVSEAVFCHHGPADLFAANTLGGLISIADFLVRKCGYPFYVSEPPPSPELLETALRGGMAHSLGGKRCLKKLSDFTKSFKAAIPDYIRGLENILT